MKLLPGVADQFVAVRPRDFMALLGAEDRPLSEKALRAQARAAERSAKLAATNFLLDHYKDEITKMQGVAYTSSDPRLALLGKIKRREQVLTEMLDLLFAEITGEQTDRAGS